MYPVFVYFPRSEFAWPYQNNSASFRWWNTKAEWHSNQRQRERQRDCLGVFLFFCFVLFCFVLVCFLPFCIYLRGVCLDRWVKTCHKSFIRSQRKFNYSDACRWSGTKMHTITLIKHIKVTNSVRSLYVSNSSI